jgi:hypothetical protein
MAKKAKQKAAKKPGSFADAVKGVKTPSVFAKTTCVLKIPPTYPSRRIPTTKEDNSFFLDLRATNALDNEVAEALTNIENVCGVNYREDLRTLEVIFSSAEARNNYRGKEIIVEGKKSLFPILPREQQPTIVYIRLANLPYGDETVIKEAISGHWKQYGRIVDIAPHKVYGKWLTRRWDLLLELSDSKKLEAPVAFELLDRPLVAAWPSSPPSCLICHSAGHQAKKCPQKIPKVGGRPDPERKDRQEKSEKGKDTETVLEVLPKPKQAKIGEETVSVSVTASTSATVSETTSVSASASVSKSVVESADSGAEGPEMLMDEDEESEDEMLDYAPFYRTGTKPERFTEAAWKVKLSSITPQEWERLAAAPANAKFDYAMQEIVDSKSKAEVNRMDTVTPPPFQFEDPTTPRKGNKRMVKDDNVVTAGNVEFVANVGGEGVRRSSRKRKPTKRK